LQNGNRAAVDPWNEGPGIAILRIFDEALARDFYVEFLGFTIDFEHRFDGDAPLYKGVSLRGCKLHLSDHFGDASPGARVYIPTEGLGEYASRLRGKSYKHERPGPPEKTPWGTLELTLHDPFGNALPLPRAKGYRASWRASSLMIRAIKAQSSTEKVNGILMSRSPRKILSVLGKS